MAPSKSLNDNSILEAALEGLEAQKARLEEQIREVRQLLGGRRPGRPAATSVPAVKKAAASRKKRALSPAARKRIAAAQKKRWAEYRKQQGPGKSE